MEVHELRPAAEQAKLLDFILVFAVLRFRFVELGPPLNTICLIGVVGMTRHDTKERNATDMTLEQKILRVKHLKMGTRTDDACIVQVL